MIARTWRGWAAQERTPVITSVIRGRSQRASEGCLRAVCGFRGARLLRRDEGGQITFTSITWFKSLDAVCGFAGADYERAIVEDAARASRTDPPGLHSSGPCSKQ
jgi:hypothetical protein